MDANETRSPVSVLTSVQSLSGACWASAWACSQGVRPTARHDREGGRTGEGHQRHGNADKETAAARRLSCSHGTQPTECKLGVSESRTLSSPRCFSRSCIRLDIPAPPSAPAAACALDALAEAAGAGVCRGVCAEAVVTGAVAEGARREEWRMIPHAEIET